MKFFPSQSATFFFKIVNTNTSKGHKEYVQMKNYSWLSTRDNIMFKYTLSSRKANGSRSVNVIVRIFRVHIMLQCIGRSDSSFTKIPWRIVRTNTKMSNQPVDLKTLKIVRTINPRTYQLWGHSWLHSYTCEM